MKKMTFLLLTTLITVASFAQADILIFHTRSAENIKIYGRDKSPLPNEPIRCTQEKKIKIRIINPNPLFYKYEIKYEEQDVKSEDKALTDALAAIGSILSTTYVQRTVNSANFLTEEGDFKRYTGIITTLLAEINKAQGIIEHSDIPESEADALNGNRNAGLRYASDQLTGNTPVGIPLTLDASANRFHSPTLAADLENSLSTVSNLNDDLKKIFKLVNSTLVKKVNEMKKTLRDAKTELESEFTVTDKEAIVYLIIKPLDPTNAALTRRINTGDEKTEIARIIPNFKRAVIELVPVGNFQFSKDVKEFYLENGLVQNRLTNKTTFKAAAVINVNFCRFGESKEMSAGLGLGYKLTSAENAFENFYLSALFSYKNFFRIGVGFGWAQFPDALKDGGKLGQPLPGNITNLNDLITYKEQPTAFLTVAFTGLNLTKKK